MRLRKNCAAWLGLAGACLFVIGCGGGVPDPGSDANAANGNMPGGGGEPAAPAPAVAQADAPKAQEPAAAETPPAQAEAPKEQAKGQGGSTTNEMLALSGGGSNPNPPAGSQSPPPGCALRRTWCGPPACGRGAEHWRPCRVVRMGGMAQQGMRAQQNQQNAMAEMQQRMQAQMKAQMPAAGGQKQQGGGGGDAKVAEGPADVHSPRGAVKTFLDALKARDADRLSEATARRAATRVFGQEPGNVRQDHRGFAVGFRARRLGQEARRLSDRRREPAQEHGPRRRRRSRSPGGNGSYMRRRITARREKEGVGGHRHQSRTGFQGDGIAAVSPKDVLSRL